LIKNYKHIIWDWNGTLFDDAWLCVEIMNKMLLRRKLKTITVEEYQNVFTFPVKDYYEKIGFDFNKEFFEIVGKEWMDEYENRKTECSLYKNVKEILNKISGLDIGQSILSAYSQNALIEIVDYFGLLSYFSHIVGLDHIYATSKVELGISLIKRLSLENNEAVLIGDTVHDFDVANEIGADCILIANGHQSKEKLLTCSVPVWNSIEEIVKPVKG
jgi:phosphoglycolate phosphatase